MEDTVYLEIAPSAQNTAVSEKIHKILCSPSLIRYVFIKIQYLWLKNAP